MKAQFEDVLKLVQDGLTIQQACIKLGDKKRSIYYHLSDEQKQTLKRVKLSNSKYGRGHKSNFLYPYVEDELNF